MGKEYSLFENLSVTIFFRHNLSCWNLEKVIHNNIVFYQPIDERFSWYQFKQIWTTIVFFFFF